MLRRFFVCLSQMACVMLLAYSITEPEPRDSNDRWTIESLWFVEPIKTLDEFCTPRTFFRSPRCQCLQSLKQICLPLVVIVDPSGSMHVPDEASDDQVDATLDHVW
jgi:hypothetical protein